MGRSNASGYAQGPITIINSNPLTGVATANSAVEVLLTDEMDTCAIQVTGVYTGALSVQASVDGVTFVTLGGTQALTNVATAVQVASIASAVVGIFQVDVSAFQRLRVTALAAMTGTATVTIAAAKTNGVVGIDTPITVGAGAAAIGTVTANIVQPTTTLLPIALNSAATTNATSQKATAGTLFEISASNQTASLKYLKLYNKASVPTVGTDVPIDTIPIPVNGNIPIEFGANGRRFTLGIAFAITGLQAIADATAVAAGDVQVAGTYI